MEHARNGIERLLDQRHGVGNLVRDGNGLVEFAGDQLAYAEIYGELQMPSKAPSNDLKIALVERLELEEFLLGRRIIDGLEVRDDVLLFLIGKPSIPYASQKVFLRLVKETVDPIGHIRIMHRQ